MCVSTVSVTVCVKWKLAVDAQLTMTVILRRVCVCVCVRVCVRTQHSRDVMVAHSPMLKLLCRLRVSTDPRFEARYAELQRKEVTGRSSQHSNLDPTDLRHELSSSRKSSSDTRCVCVCVCVHGFLFFKFVCLCVCVCVNRTCTFGRMTGTFCVLLQ